jgi:DNA-binding beta-propeller fold protein YncE
MLRILVVGLLAAIALAGPAAAAQEGTRPVLFVANNWDGTADVIDPQRFTRLARINVVPDLQERLREIHSDPRRIAYYLGIRQLVGEGNDQYADDIFSSPDGRFIYVSRPSLADVVGLELATGRIVWRVPMEGYRSDHMAISADGSRLLVSDSTARKVHVIDPRAGRKVAEFPSGDSPHENNYSRDGSRIFHASIGHVYTPADHPVADSTKGDRWFQIVDASTYQILRRLDIGQIMAAHGHEGYSSAVRPMALSPDERTAYLQLSFLHGFVEFDLTTERPLRIAQLPVSEEAANTPREQYLLDSAHHGLAINPEGTKLCAAGTMSDYAAIVDRFTFSHRIFQVGRKPYWSTNSGDGRTCFVSVSGDDRVVAIDYASEREVARIAVGDHPQRMRMGVVRNELVGGAPPGGAAVPRAARAPARLRVVRAAVRGGRLRLRLKMHPRATGRLRGTYVSRGRRSRLRLPIRGRTWSATRRVSGGGRTGIVRLRYAGNRRVRPERLRTRAARRRPQLKRTVTRIAAGHLTVRGRIHRRARGLVRVRLDLRDDETHSLGYTARIRRGRWSVREPLPSKAATEGGHLAIRYTGQRSPRLRGAQLHRSVRP